MVLGMLVAAVFAQPALTAEVQRPEMISRAEWGAKDPVLPMKEHRRAIITIHHAGVPTKKEVSTAQKIKNLQLFSQREDKLASGKVKPQWPDVPYHYYIGFDGKIAEGRDDRYVGDTNTDYDPSGHVLICLEGNFEEELPAKEQLESLKKLVLWLAVRDGIHERLIKSHRDYTKQTSCPGKNMEGHLEDLREYVQANRG
jgi:hypothetical protein